jgi:asparagine synthase (glutamine-hydrolysing)
MLPKNIIYRPKSGFGAPLRDWLQGDLSEFVDEYLSVEKINERGIFNSSKIQNLINEDRRGNEDYSYSIFALLCFEIWCQKFLD